MVNHFATLFAWFCFCGTRWVITTRWYPNFWILFQWFANKDHQRNQIFRFFYSFVAIFPISQPKSKKRKFWLRNFVSFDSGQYIKFSRLFKVICKKTRAKLNNKIYIYRRLPMRLILRPNSIVIILKRS